MVPVCFFRCHDANFEGYPAVTTQQTWGGEFFYLHLGPGLLETGKPLSLTTRPLVISAATMGGGGIFGSIFVVRPLNTLIITDYHSHERPNHGRLFDLLASRPSPFDRATRRPTPPRRPHSPSSSFPLPSLRPCPFNRGGGLCIRLRLSQLSP